MSAPRSLTGYAGSRDNNFNLIRFVAAALVLVSHSWPLALGPRREDPLYQLTGHSLGTLAVEIFFFASGFLVTASLINRADALDFARARILRVFPGLIVAVLASAVILGLMFSPQPFASYFFSKETLGFIVAKSTFLINGHHYLPGVFTGNPAGPVVNGSLWTLPREIRMYVLLALFWVVAGLALRFIPRLRRSPRTFEAIVHVAAIGALAAHFVDYFTKQLPGTVSLSGLFFMGSSAYLLRTQIVLRTDIFAACCIALLASLAHPFAFFVVHHLVIGYIVLWLAYVPAGPIRSFNAAGDYSYGVYIYAHPVQQAAVALIPGLTVASMIALAFPVTLIFAILSWHLVEERALRLKSRPFAFWRTRDAGA